MPTSPAVLLLLLLVGFALQNLTGCRSRSPTVEEIKRVFPEQQKQEDSLMSNAVDVYVDGSGSMLGFLASKDSVYRKTLADLLLLGTENRFDQNVYRFSTTIQLVKGSTTNAVQETDFYKGLDTPLASLLAQIATHPDRTAIVVSDLVLSSKSEDSQKLVQVLAALASRRPQIKLLGYRSDFHGQYGSERVPGQKYKLSLTQSVPFGGRPFYVLIVAPNSASMEKVQRSLLNHLEAKPEVYDATARAFVVQAAALRAPSKEKPEKPQWRAFSRYMLRNKESERFETAFRLTHSVSADKIDLPVVFHFKPNVLLGRPDGLSLDAQEAVFRRDKSPSPQPQPSGSGGWAFSPAATVAIPISGQIKDQKEQSDSQMALTLSLDPPKRQEWDVYRIRMRPGDSNLELPGWIKDWSTDDDSTDKTGNKTYMLQLLVGTMENAVTQEQVCSEWILKVGGEE